MYRWLWGLIVGALVVGVWLPADLSAHPGRTDSAGGHTCRTNCPSYGLAFGEYHFHGGSSSSGSSSDSSSGTGTTTPTTTPTTSPTPTSIRASFERTPTPGESYAIQAGDTLSAIATRFGLTVEGLLALNPELTDASRIVVGQEILLREPTAAPAPSTESDPAEAEEEEPAVEAEPAAESDQAEPQQPSRPAREPTEEPQPAAAPAADDAQEDDDGGFGAAGAVIVLGAVGIGALVWWRRRTRAGSSDA